VAIARPISRSNRISPISRGWSPQRSLHGFDCPVFLCRARTVSSPTQSACAA
jgi:hypothetical protein